MNSDADRIVFLDWLRAIAIFMVLLIHACEPFYIDAEGTAIASKFDAVWVTIIDSAMRAAVPLFVIASAFLLFPVRRPTGDFLKRRLARVLIPFGIWTCVYMAVQGGDWRQLLFNFPSDYGHLWFVWMLVGVYLLMPLLSPWAEKVSEKELRGWILLWLFTTLLPFISVLAKKTGFSWELYGQAPWNAFHSFYYASGFIGYLFVGLYMRRFLKDWSWLRTLSRAILLFAAGWAIVAGGFWKTLEKYLTTIGTDYPVKTNIQLAIDMETTWGFTSFGVALTVLAYVLVLRKFNWNGAFYRRVVQPCAKASYGVYLVHMLILPRVVDSWRVGMTTPLCIVASAVVTFAISTLAVLVLARIPHIGEDISGCRLR